MSEENTISNIKINGTTYAITDPSKASLEEVTGLIEITTENTASILSANNKLDELLSKVESSKLDTSDATATSSVILSGFTAYANGAKVTGNMEDHGDYMWNVTSKSYTPLPSGYYLSIDLNIDGIDNIQAGNIRSGVSILGVTGTLEEGSDVDLSVVTAEAKYVLSDKKFVNSAGEPVTGTASDYLDNPAVMVQVTHVYGGAGDVVQLQLSSPINGDATAMINGNTLFYTMLSGINGYNVTPTKAAQTICRNAYVYGTLTVDPIPDEYITTTDADATAADIAKDKIAYVKGQKVTGTMEAASADSSSGGMEFYKCASVGSESAGGEASTRNGIIVHNVNSDESFTLEYNAEYDAYVYEIAMGEAYWLSYETTDFISKNIPGWIFWYDFAGHVDAKCGNKTAGADADTAEIVAGPWADDFSGSASDYTFSEDGQAAPTIWAGYKMVWSDGWQETTELVEGLEVKGYTPEVGKIYSADTTMWAQKFL